MLFLLLALPSAGLPSTEIPRHSASRRGHVPGKYTHRHTEWRTFARRSSTSEQSDCRTPHADPECSASGAYRAVRFPSFERTPAVSVFLLAQAYYHRQAQGSAVRPLAVSYYFQKVPSKRLAALYPERKARGWTARARRPSSRPRREDRICLRVWGQSRHWFLTFETLMHRLADPAYRQPVNCGDRVR